MTDPQLAADITDLITNITATESAERMVRVEFAPGGPVAHHVDRSYSVEVRELTIHYRRTHEQPWSPVLVTARGPRADVGAVEPMSFDFRSITYAAGAPRDSWITELINGWRVHVEPDQSEEQP